MTLSIINLFDEPRTLLGETLYDSGFGVYPVIPGSRYLLVEMSGAGGGGGSSIVGDTPYIDAGGQGGQSGAAAVLLVQIDSAITTIDYSIGTGGLGTTSIDVQDNSSTLQYGNTPFDSGGDTTFGNFIRCLGGTPGQPAVVFNNSDNAGGSILNTLKLYQNNPWDSDVYRGYGVFLYNPTFNDPLVLDYRLDLGYAAGGRGSNLIPKLEIGLPGDPAGVISANSGQNYLATRRSPGGGGGSTYFGFGGQGGNPSFDSDSCAGRDALVGYGGGGGGAAAAVDSVSSTVKFKYYGPGGRGANGFIRIRSYK